MAEHFGELAAILAETFKVPVEQIKLESRLKEDLSADSLDASTALMDIEDKFGIIVPDERRVYITVGDILAHVEELLSQQATVAVTAAPKLEARSIQ